MKSEDWIRLKSGLSVGPTSPVGLISEHAVSISPIPMVMEIASLDMDFLNFMVLNRVGRTLPPLLLVSIGISYLKSKKK